MCNWLRLFFCRFNKSNVEKLELEIKQLEIDNLNMDLRLKMCKIRAIVISTIVFTVVGFLGGMLLYIKIQKLRQEMSELNTSICNCEC